MGSGIVDGHGVAAAVHVPADAAGVGAPGLLVGCLGADGHIDGGGGAGVEGVGADGQRVGALHEDVVQGRAALEGIAAHLGHAVADDHADDLVAEECPGSGSLVIVGHGARAADGQRAGGSVEVPRHVAGRGLREVVADGVARAIIQVHSGVAGVAGSQQHVVRHGVVGILCRSHHHGIGLGRDHRVAGERVVLRVAAKRHLAQDAVARDGAASIITAISTDCYVAVDGVACHRGSPGNTQAFRKGVVADDDSIFGCRGSTAKIGGEINRTVLDAMTQTIIDSELGQSSTTLRRNRAIKHANVVIVHRIVCWLVVSVIGIAYKQDIAGAACILEACILEGAIVGACQHAATAAAVVLGIDGAAVQGDVVAVAQRHMAQAGADFCVFHPHGDAGEGDVARVEDPRLGVLYPDVLHRSAGAGLVDDEALRVHHRRRIFVGHHSSRRVQLHHRILRRRLDGHLLVHNQRVLQVNLTLEVQHVARCHSVAQRVAVAAEDCVHIVLIHDVGRLRPRARRRRHEQREQK